MFRVYVLLGAAGAAVGLVVGSFFYGLNSGRQIEEARVVEAALQRMKDRGLIDEDVQDLPADELLEHLLDASPISVQRDDDR